MDAEQFKKNYEPHLVLKGVVLKEKPVANAVLFLAYDDSLGIT